MTAVLNDVMLEEASGLVKAKVVRVIDGDTINVIIDGTTERVRFIGVDSPECGDTGFEEATEFTRSQIANVGNIVWLASSGNDRDRFNRLRRYVWLDDFENMTEVERVDSSLLLNQTLVDSGHAVMAMIVQSNELEDSE